MELAMAVKLLLVFLSLWRVYIVCGKTSIFEDDLELEKQLKILNKPPIKTFVMVFVLVDDVDTKYGAEAHMSVYNLTVPQDLFSAHKLSMENGPDDHLSTIHAGWGVHPTLNGDGLTRLITVWTGDGFRNGCFNTQCPGFVQIHREVAPNYPLSPTSTYGGDIYELIVHVEQDRRTRNWWLVVRHDIAIGYWQSELFVNLAGGTKRVSWGGEGFSGNAGTCPPLGSGRMPDGHYNHGTYFRRINYMAGSTRNQTPLAVFEHVNKSKVYGLKNDRYIRKKDMGYSFTYGGPGGACAQLC